EARGLTLAHPEVRSRLAAGALAKLPGIKPSPLYDDSLASLITPGNIDDHLDRIGEVDWVIEVVMENLAIKQELLRKIESRWKPGIIVSSNTSGISIHAMAEGRSEAFKSHFLGTHFFNPPRYMKLLEVIPGESTDSDIVSRIVECGERTLGKGVVIAKDTPNFIANRIGTYGLLAAMQIMEEKGFTVDEVDAVTGPAMGRPKSATFRTLDLVGLDTFVHVANNVAERTGSQAEKTAFALPQV
ncbi:3-hydroxyacyl-CoA dehydrogenase family protein, partial [Paenibacillus sepulcri]|nr:3-hydroxyacyl-CoA dehydrogenase family protein [Paenibacillus sepulcri]